MNKDQYERAMKIAEMIQRAITDITEAVAMNIDEDDPMSKLSAYSALCTVTSYYDFKLRESGFTNSEIEATKTSAEKYVLTLISEELETIPLKKGDA